MDLWNHWLNPFGNYHEPMPTPDSVKERGPANPVLAFLWWQFLRNPLHNFTHFWIGISPIGPPRVWLDPKSTGWKREYGRYSNRWVRGSVKLPVFHFLSHGWEGYIGWKYRGNFGMALRRR